MLARSAPLNTSLCTDWTPAPSGPNRQSSVDAVNAHLRVLFARFGLEDLPQYKTRARLAATVLVSGTIEPHEL